jgi:UDP-4-amino-4,6-dideoxy-N-acetyl-beta-L-altrosamine N-acetyltransferase
MLVEGRTMIRLRAFEDADADPLLRWRNDAEVSRWMYDPHRITPDEHARWFERVRDDAPDHRYRVVELDGVASGTSNLTQIDPDRRSCTWGGYVAPASIGRGVGRAALGLALVDAFEALDLNRVWIEVLADNDRAVHLYESIGFTREAVLRQLVWRDERPKDVIGLSMLRSEWQELRAGVMDGVASVGGLA